MYMLQCDGVYRHHWRKPVTNHTANAAKIVDIGSNVGWYHAIGWHERVAHRCITDAPIV